MWISGGFATAQNLARCLRRDKRALKIAMEQLLLVAQEEYLFAKASAFRQALPQRWQPTTQTVPKWNPGPFALVQSDKIRGARGGMPRTARDHVNRVANGMKPLWVVSNCVRETTRGHFHDKDNYPCRDDGGDGRRICDGQAESPRVLWTKRLLRDQGSRKSTQPVLRLSSLERMAALGQLGPLAGQRLSDKPALCAIRVWRALLGSLGFIASLHRCAYVAPVLRPIARP
jgi:hypothetical protein